LIAASALAAGVVSSQAQVYSQNIVGYVNSTLPSGYSIQSAPFDVANGNNITNLISNPAASPTYDGSYLYVWGGHSFAVYTIDSTQPTGVADPTDSYATNAPTLNPGISWFFDNESGSQQTNTFVGTVHIGSGSYPGTSTNVISSTTLNAFLAPVIPVGGGISSVDGFTNVLTAGPGTGNLDGDYIEIPNFVGGHVHGYTTITIDSTQSTGFADATDSTAVPEPQIPVAGGFLFNNANGTTINWIQSLGQ